MEGKMKRGMKGRKITREGLEQDGWKDDGINYEGHRILRRGDSKIVWDEEAQRVKDELEGEIEARLRNTKLEST